MKEISKMDEKPFTSSLNTVSLQKPAVKRGGDGRNVASPSQSLHECIPADSWIFRSCKDYVTVMC